jgi:hypothetical protein
MRLSVKVLATLFSIKFLAPQRARDRSDVRPLPTETGGRAKHQLSEPHLQAVQVCKASSHFLRNLRKIAPSQVASQPGRQPARPGQA